MLREPFFSKGPNPKPSTSIVQKSRTVGEDISQLLSQKFVCLINAKNSVYGLKI